MHRPPTHWYLVTAVNLVVLLILIVLAELALGDWFKDKAYCWDEVLHHSYCPGISDVTRLAREDGAAVIDVHINRSLVRVASPKEIDQTTDTSQFEVINLGDSFLQADELPYQQTLGQVMMATSGKKVLDFGYSSWAPLIHRNWLERQKLRNGVRVNIFVMVNDMTPDGSYSTLGYRKEAKPDGRGSYVFDVPVEDRSFRAIVVRRSFLHRKKTVLMDYMRHELLGRPRPQPKDRFEKNPWLTEDRDLPSDDCGIVERLREASPPRSSDYLTPDYVSFSFSHTCWTADQNAEVLATAEDLNAIVELVDKVGGSVRVYLIPPGWAFKGENLIGKQAGYYRISEPVTITTLPLAEHLRTLVRAPVIALEPVIKRLKAEAPGRYFFPVDGHWTALAHREIGRWLIDQP